MAADGLVGGEPEHVARGVVPKDDVVRTIRHEDGIGRMLERLKECRELCIVVCQVQVPPPVSDRDDCRRDQSRPEGVG